MSWLTRLLRGEDAPMLTASGPMSAPGVVPAPGVAPASEVVPGPGSGPGVVPAPASGSTGPASGAALTGATLRARAAAIHHTKFREGYDIPEVDAFLKRAAAALDGTGTGAALTAADVLNVKFHPTKFREGYDQDVVDDLLDEVVLALRVRD